MSARPAHVPEHLVVEYDALDPVPAEEVLAKAEEWRKLGPVVWTDSNHGHWVVLSSELARTVLSNPERFSSSKPGQGITLTRTDRELHVPLELDGAEHRAYRKILMPLFSPARVRKLEEQARKVSVELIDAFFEKERPEIVSEFARPLAGAMFLGLVDWPASDRERLEKLAEMELNPPGDTKEEKAKAKSQALAELAAYVIERVRERRENPTDDMTTVILNSKLDDGSPIPDGKLIPMLVLLCIAGLDTTQSVLARSLEYMGRNPETQAAFRKNLDTLPKMVEELLRWNTPAVPNRTVMEDCELGGVQIKEGDTVQCLLQAANRDENEFPEPWKVDFQRKVNRHLAFSVGPHTCLGASLARVILNSALDEFHRRIEHYEVVSSESHAGAVWGMKNVYLNVRARNSTDSGDE